MSNNDAAPGFDPFDSSVQTETLCGSGWAVMVAGQQSQIDGDTMSASGHAFLKSTGPGAANVLATAE